MGRLNAGRVAVAESWVGLFLSLLAWHETCRPRIVSDRYSHIGPEIACIAVLDGLAMALAIGGIRFSTGFHRWIAIAAMLLSGSLLVFLILAAALLRAIYG
jgi:hypothetical protein